MFFTFFCITSSSIPHYSQDWSYAYIQSVRDHFELLTGPENKYRIVDTLPVEDSRGPKKHLVRLLWKVHTHAQLPMGIVEYGVPAPYSVVLFTCV